MNRITPLSGALLTAGYLFGGFAIGVGIGGAVEHPVIQLSRSRGTSSPA